MFYTFKKVEGLLSPDLNVVMSRNVGWKFYVQAPWGIADLLVRLDLLQLETGRKETVLWSSSIAGEVKVTELIPRLVQHMIGAGCVQSFALLDNFACKVFDPDSGSIFERGCVTFLASALPCFEYIVIVSNFSS